MGGSQNRGQRPGVGHFRTICGALGLGALLTVSCGATFKSIDSPEIKATIPVSISSTPAGLEVEGQPTATHVPEATATLLPTSTALPKFVANDLHPSASYRLPLVTRNVTDTQVVVYFELDAPAEGYLYIWEEGGRIEEGRVIPLNQELIEHTIIIDGLPSEKVYQATVGLLGNQNQYFAPRYYREGWGPIQFETIAETRSSFRFGVIGDSGFGEPITYALAERMAKQELDFVLHTGDIVYKAAENADPYEAFAQKYFLPMKHLLLQVPIYAVVGNHDVESALHVQGAPLYETVFECIETSAYHCSNTEHHRWSVLEYSGYQFLLLDSQTFLGAEGRQAQDEWLLERLMDQRYKLTIPVFHIAPFSSGLHPNDGLAIRQQWHPLFAESNVDLVLNGHDHNYQRLQADGINYIVSGGGSGVLYSLVDESPLSAVFSKQSHFVIIEIGESMMNITALDENAEILDEYSTPIQPN
jgi:acid phosphatase type 7